MAASHVALTIADDIDLNLMRVADGTMSPAAFVDSMANLVGVIRALDEADYGQ